MNNLTSRLRALPALCLTLIFSVAIAAVSGMSVAFGGPPLNSEFNIQNSKLLYADGRLTSANTYTDAKAQNSAVVGQLFSKLMLLQTSNKDILGQMEGPEGSGRPITIKTDLKKGAGDTVNFTTLSRPGGEGAIGETLLEAEELDFGSYSVTIDFLRHGLGMTEKVKTFLAAGMSLEEAFAEQESEWFALRRQADCFMLWRRFATATNTIRPNDKATDDLLLTADAMKTTLISDVASLLKTRGAPPAKVNKTKVGQFTADVLSYIILASDRFLTPLKSNSTYLQNLRDAGVRGDDNVIWSGGYAKYDGHFIFHLDSVHEDTKGPIGVPIEPEALLGTAITAGTTAVDITGGGRTSPSSVHKPFKWFKGYAYPLLGQADPSTDSGTYYLVIYNVSGSDAGKFGIYSYVGSDNNGNKITMTSRLGPSATGAAVTSLAGITYDSTKHTNAHPTGSRIVQVNAKCVPYCYGIGMGAMAALRPYGGPEIKPIVENGDWGMKKGMGFQAIYGQGLCKDTQNNVRNYVLIVAAYRPQGLNNLPTVTS